MPSGRQIRQQQQRNWRQANAGLPSSTGAKLSPGTTAFAPEDIPSGGSSGQVLRKSSASDYETEWGDVVETNPPSGFYKITNLYYDDTNGQLVPVRSNTVEP